VSNVYCVCRRRHLAASTSAAQQELRDFQDCDAYCTTTNISRLHHTDTSDLCGLPPSTATAAFKFPADRSTTQAATGQFIQYAARCGSRVDAYSPAAPLTLKAQYPQQTICSDGSDDIIRQSLATKLSARYLDP